jgi:pimeloyl-ACP methyl ester carboxylesterase
VITFPAADGVRLAYHRTGDGEPLVCVPGGPLQSSAYLADLGGLPSLVRLDLRGTGESAAADPTTYRCDRLVDDVEALRRHLGLARMDLLGHSAGAAVAVLYATRHPEHVARLVLVTPTARVVDLEIPDEDRHEVAELGRRAGVVPATIEPNVAAIPVYYADGALDPPATRAALGGFDAPVLLVAGEYDMGLPPKSAAEYAGLFPNAELAVAPASGHFPWLDDPASFASIVDGWLTTP